MKSFIPLAVSVCLASCGTHRQCAQVCDSLHAVKPDSQGYFPRDAIFQAAGVSQPYLTPAIYGLGGGCVALPCGCRLTFTERHCLPKGRIVSIDHILNNPNRNAYLPAKQFDSVTLVDRHGRTACRIETPKASSLRAKVEASLPDPNSPPLLEGTEEISIKSCPAIGWHFKIAPYLSVAKSLQDQGREKAIQQLQSWADSGKHEDQVIILCRMLFEARKDRRFREPQIGAPALLGRTNGFDWPLEPIEIFERVPILITYGYLLSGAKESSKLYLNYCVKTCSWSNEHYAVRPDAELKKIVARWLSQRKWPPPLSDRDRAFFTDQAEQDAAGQPATRPKSAPEGNRKPRPKAEARSR